MNLKHLYKGFFGDFVYLIHNKNASFSGNMTSFMKTIVIITLYI
ncbi:hypothetical protein HMPREF0061_0696 [Aerococcus viridans ATCC 11563 = CCUG 4311]|uniref:Uncharacterized protein n=1 Tax=Aerococcus viridans (strain ATCC 11563 / DSM 20340 / CCUG 4311 / JCM 20461 / NBRC 12219 / NCTC 8251 / M1) TaxID=655812 RepID=A0ABP2I7X2_AERVM|nr:hypothetical protein HMPREF0061_0696 [Aerococcus viridans ATCC 11563 = CCUG 4311]